MNPRERVIAALERRHPDRVPIAEMWIDPGVVDALLPGADANELVDHLDMDIVAVPTMVYEQDEIEWVDREARHPLFRGKWGALQIMDGAGVPVPTVPPRIDTGEDLARYTPPDPSDSPVIDKIRRLKAQYPDVSALELEPERRAHEMLLDAVYRTLLSYEYGTEERGRLTTAYCGFLDHYWEQHSSSPAAQTYYLLFANPTLCD